MKVLASTCGIITNKYFLDIFEPGNSTYIPFLPLTGDGVLLLPPVDDGSYPITLLEPLPLGTAQNVTTYTTAYVS